MEEPTSSVNPPKWGRRMYLISPSEYETLKKNQSKNPFFQNKNANDYQSQLHDKKICSGQIKNKNDFEKKKTEISNLLKPVFNDSDSLKQSLTKGFILAI